MPRTIYQTTYTCVRCLRTLSPHNGSQINSSRSFYKLSPLRSSSKMNEGEGLSIDADALNKTSDKGKSTPNSVHGSEKPEQGAMSRRLAQATEDALLEGGRAGRKAVEEAGFSEELKEKLLERVAASRFQSENARAFAEAGLSSNVGRGSRDIATGQAWSGTEAPEDTMLRMLDDARKPLKPSQRGSVKIPNPMMDLRLKPKPKLRAGERLANARDKTSIYAISKDSPMTDKEREDMRKELKERFTPGARAMPNSFRGLAALANERIEDAISRGQFKNIPRGKMIERDTRADNPFIDATEYILNKMIQRQDIVPPWIEKQQELVKAANVFRARLRNDWKRHAARTIASRGGSLQDQMRNAERYAEAERVYNPKKRAVDQISVPTNATNDSVTLNITQEAPTSSSTRPIIVSAHTKDAEIQIKAQPAETLPPPREPLPSLFRIPSWEAAEHSYLTLAIKNLNDLTRSYNLMAPDLAKKPYFSLERELKSCYADTAPQLAETIKERAAKPPKELVEKIAHRPGSVFEKFASDKAVIYDSKRPPYGFKEFWSDLFRKEKET